MRTLLLLGFISIALLSYNSAFAQFNASIMHDDFALLEKNVNVRASSLIHRLNATKDTLILSSHKKINRVYSVNMNYEREVQANINATFFKVPLTKLSQGKHVFVVVQSPLRIIFVIKILKDNTIILPPNEIKLTALQKEDH
ncbi:hypothetical protein A9Q87_13715 [Flavobacteriales bacterium 34_180_T64]|nr:hypothetical protein A9Q87_13715 [Flavobacteriales bacterium 34_180_T64]